jgi:sulfotransferase family protein
VRTALDALRRAAFRSRRARAGLVRVRQRGLDPRDALIVSYPRSGTTWLRFVLAECLTGRSSEFDPDTHPVQYVGRHRRAPGILPDGGRLIYSHETLAVGDRRIVYIVRDPRAVALSEYRWLQRRRLAPSTMDAFVRRFVQGRSNPWGSWGDHVRAWTASEAATGGNLTLVRFEALREDTERVVSDLVRSLGAVVDHVRIADAVRNNALEEMQAKERRAPDRAFAKRVRRDVPFVKAGAVADWSEELSPEHRKMIEAAFADPMRAMGYETTH